MSEAMKTNRALTVVSLVAVVLISGIAQGDILGFVPEPASPSVPEFIWDGSMLTEGPGAVGTGYMTIGPGDGELPSGTQAVGGLTVVAPFAIPGIPGSTVGAGSTTFYDATLDILGAGLPAAGPASLLAGTVFQPLGSGAFEIWSTDPLTALEEDQTLLLAGTVNSAVITGLLNETTGATLSADVTYTAGAIVDAMNEGPLYVFSGRGR